MEHAFGTSPRVRTNGKTGYQHHKSTTLRVRYSGDAYPEYDFHYPKLAGRFGFDDAPFLEDVEHIKHDEYTTSLNLAVTEYLRQHKDDARLQQALVRCVFRAPYVANDRLAYVTPNGDYEVERNPRCAEFKTDLYNLLNSECSFDEPKLLIAYNKSHSRTPEIAKNPKYAFSDEHLPFLEQVQQRVAHHLLREALAASADDVVLDAKKLTSIGPPYRTVSGEPVELEDIVFYADAPSPILHMRADWSRVKKGWFEDPKGSLALLVSSLECDSDITPNNIAEMTFETLQTGWAAIGERNNCPDTVVNVQQHYDGKSPVWSKDRLFTTAGPGGVTYGKLNVQAYNIYLHNAMKQPLASNRVRPIYSCNTVTQAPAIVLMHMMFQRIERTGAGFLSVKPETKARYAVLQHKAQMTGLCIRWFRQDRSNSEIAVTTNFETMLNFFPKSVRRYLRRLSCVTLPSRYGMRVQPDAMTSGLAITTGGTSVLGLYAAAVTFVLSWRGNLRITDRAKQLADILAIIDSVLGEYDTPVVALSNGVLVTTFMVTDDVAWPFIAPNDATPDQQWLDDYGQATQLNTEVLDEVTAFGVYGTADALQATSKSIIAKLPFAERAGFIPRDAMSFWIRLQLITPEFREVVDFCLKKHYGAGIQEYQRFLPMFWRSMADAGLDVTDVVSQFSPVERYLMTRMKSVQRQVVFGKWVSDDTWTATSRIGTEYVSRFVDVFKSLLSGEAHAI